MSVFHVPHLGMLGIRSLEIIETYHVFILMLIVSFLFPQMVQNIDAQKENKTYRIMKVRHFCWYAQVHESRKNKRGRLLVPGGHLGCGHNCCPPEVEFTFGTALIVCGDNVFFIVLVNAFRLFDVIVTAQRSWDSLTFLS